MLSTKNRYILADKRRPAQRGKVNIDWWISPVEGTGINLGDAAATIIYKGIAADELKAGQWYVARDAIRNDAFHISGPSRTGEGCWRALQSVLKDSDTNDIAFLNAHGTATLFNDEMESVAIDRAGLNEVPVNSLKGYFGHTMGAAGVLETIISMQALNDGLVLGTKGFEHLGVSKHINVSAENKHTTKHAFVKMMSGFGGCNVAAMYEKTTDCGIQTTDKAKLVKSHTIKLSSEDGTSLTDIYKQQIGNYPKFYKMDILSRLAFVATELLLKNGQWSMVNGQWSVILFNHSSSIVADRQFLDTIKDAENFFPSPSVFVYTLPNITTGEIAIRHHLCGETSFYILHEKDETLMQQILEATLSATKARNVISGWIDAESDTDFECDLSMYNKISNE